MIPFVRGIAISLSATLFVVYLSAAAQAPPEAPLAQPVPLVFQGIHVTSFRETSAGYSPQERAEGALRRLEALRSGQLTAPIHRLPSAGGEALYVGQTLAFQVLNGDLDLRLARSRAEQADSAESRLARALARRAHLYSPQGLIRSVILAIAGTIIFAFLIWLLLRAHRLATHYVSHHATGILIKDVGGATRAFEILRTTIRSTFALVSTLVLLALVSLWATFLLNRFPDTQHVGRATRRFQVDVLHRFADGVVGATPGILTAILIGFLAHALARMVSELFLSAERGLIHLPGIHPETASATRRILLALIWTFALVLAYPFLPGSDSDIFRGVSVFLGILFTLGSAGFVGHMMSGLVLVYSRALRKGDYVQIGDVRGTVLEVGALSTKLAVQPRAEEFTVPNTLLASSTVRNLTRLGGDHGPALVTSVTIGYDAPWRVVNELLLGAADRTPGLRKQPPPIVLQTQLSEFHVEYQLIARLEQGEQRLLVLDKLHRNILDGFNERGVQMMTPHYESQPERAVVVPKAKWSVAPFDDSTAAKPE